MERDFLGLNPKEPLAAVKPELSNSDDVQWWWMNKASSFPPLSSFGAGPIPGAAHDDQMDKMNVSEAITRQQFEGVGKPVGYNVSFAEVKPLWKHFKSSTAPPPPQMTIFYGGTVGVYDGISPEKAQALMLMAGKGSFLASNKNPLSPRIQSPAFKVPSTVADGIPIKGEQVEAITTEISLACVSKPERRRVPSRGPVPIPTVTLSVVPQFRKASLARFLEKRKDRMMTTGPYTCEKKQGGILPANDNVGSAMP